MIDKYGNYLIFYLLNFNFDNRYTWLHIILDCRMNFFDST